MCIYDSCIFPCLTKSEHNSKYATMRRCRNEPQITTPPKKSSKVNWSVVYQMNFKDLKIVKDKIVKDKVGVIDDEYLLSLEDLF